MQSWACKSKQQLREAEVPAHSHVRLHLREGRQLIQLREHKRLHFKRAHEMLQETHSALQHGMACNTLRGSDASCIMLATVQQKQAVTIMSHPPPPPLPAPRPTPCSLPLSPIEKAKPVCVGSLQHITARTMTVRKAIDLASSTRTEWGLNQCSERHAGTHPRLTLCMLPCQGWNSWWLLRMPESRV